MDDGDGKSFVAHDEATARQDVNWHRYNSPGSYTARAWAADSFGRRDEAACTFTCFGGSNGGGGASPSYNDDDDHYSGDLDCEDVGAEIWVGDDDPDGLDGDGYGCDGWW